jgi:hypothetical protein
VSFIKEDKESIQIRNSGGFEGWIKRSDAEAYFNQYL